MATRVLVTGATGFVGKVLCDVLGAAGYVVRAALRTDRHVPSSVAETAITGEINAATRWQEALRDVDVVIHLAARVHVAAAAARDSELYLETNANGTRTLAEASALAGVRRFVYLSSVKVNGEENSGRAYTIADTPRPRDAYGISKWMAEKYLTEIAAQAAMETVSVRAPLVYGPGVRANFLRLMIWVDKQWPLPLGAIDNRRSLVSIWNLCDLLLKTVEGPAASRPTWMVSDGHDVSTPELIRCIGAAMNRRVRLWPVPAGVLRLGGILAQRDEEIQRLCGSLTVDITQTVQDLRWTPPMTLEQSLARTVDWYLNTDARRAA